MADVKKREYWIDNVKVVACLLVALRHFFMSMTKSGILPKTEIYVWLDIIPWYCAVQVFFFCSGYLYQKRSKIETVGAWYYGIVNKLIAFGIPYFVFTTLTWLLKTIFASSVNDQVGTLTSALFISPIAPYWYLYTAFFIFMFTITMGTRTKMLLITIAAVLLKISTVFFDWFGIYALSKTFEQLIWFVLGMLLAYFIPKEKTLEVKKKWNWLCAGIVILIVFLFASWYGCKAGLYNRNGLWIFAMSVLSSAALVIIPLALSKTDSQPKIFALFSKYLMPIFLMHTLTAAPFRILLLKLGIKNPVMHVVFGLTITIFAPILIAFIMSKVKVLDAILYPTKYIKIRPKQKEKQ